MMSGSEPRGRLILVGTPIGNLGDLTPRAIETLAQADLVCCEDTRRTGRLLEHAGIRAKGFRVTNEHTEAAVSVEVVERIANGQSVAVVSDAGMPGVSDPGERLVNAVVEAGGIVEVVPGPSAALAGLVLSALPTGRFVFEGFLPRKGQARHDRLDAVASEPRTTVLFEAPHRLEKTLGDLVAVCGNDRRVSIAREITKLHEQVWRGTLGEALSRCEQVAPRGEYVVVVGGAPQPAEVDDDTILAELKRAREAGSSTRDAVGDVAEMLKVAKRRVYDLATSKA